MEHIALIRQTLSKAHLQKAEKESERLTLIENEKGACLQHVLGTTS